MTLLDRVGVFFGLEVAGALYAVEGRKGDARLTGYIADPACERGTAKMQYLFVNGRWVRDRSLGHAVQEAYRGLLMTGRYAVVFLFLDLPPDQVDVNVHPTKAEVRFRDAQALYHLVFGTVRDRLRAENLTARLQVPSTMRPSRPWKRRRRSTDCRGAPLPPHSRAPAPPAPSPPAVASLRQPSPSAHRPAPDGAGAPLSRPSRRVCRRRGRTRSSSFTTPIW